MDSFLIKRLKTNKNLERMNMFSLYEKQIKHTVLQQITDKL